MTRKRNYKKLFYALLTLLLFVIAVVGGRGIFPAFADTTGYTSALTDLKKDRNFKVSDYPENSKDYSIQVKQIAESKDGELFLYTYQPCQKNTYLIATQINMSFSKSANDTRLYNLSLLNSDGVFCKYMVNGVKVGSEAVRYYNITSIYRPFYSGIDKAPADGQKVSEVAYKVAQLWTVNTVNGNVEYSMLGSEVIEITQKIVGYCIYDDGYNLGWGAMEGITKAYFVAFDTDKPIDKLISADLTFFATRSHCKICLNDKHKDHDLLYDFDEGEYIDYGTGIYNDEPLTITDRQSFGNQGGGNVRPATKFLYKRIRKTETFIADNNNEDYHILSDGQSALSNTKWVLNFYEAQDKYKVDNVWLSFIPGVTKINGVADGECELNNVYDVSILRLEFETNGKQYNLGVIDNKQTGGNSPFNEPIVKTFFEKMAEKLGVPVWVAKFIFYGGIVLIICAILLPILSLIFPVVGQVLKLVLNGIVRVISAPFRFIAWVVRKIKGGD